MFESYLGESILARAIKEKRLKVNFINPRKFVTGKYKKVWPDGNISQQIDERPYGGGPGMVMMAEPIIGAVESVIAKIEKQKPHPLTPSPERRGGSEKKLPKIKIINFVPSAKKFDTKYAKNSVKKYTDIILICGRYEGIDARINKILSAKGGPASGGKFECLSVGDYVLTGGELPAMILIDCISRQIPGVLGNFDSREEERVSSSNVYTRPEVIVRQDLTTKKIKKYRVPKVLLSGNHKEIEEWKKAKK